MLYSVYLRYVMKLVGELALISRLFIECGAGGACESALHGSRAVFIRSLVYFCSSRLRITNMACYFSSSGSSDDDDDVVDSKRVKYDNQDEEEERSFPNTYMIDDIRCFRFDEKPIRYAFSLRNYYGRKVQLLVNTGNTYNLYFDILEGETRLDLPPKIQCVGNTPRPCLGKYNMMGYSAEPLRLWQLTINRNFINAIEQFCRNTERKMYYCMSLCESYPLMHKQLGVFIHVNGKVNGNTFDSIRANYTDVCAPPRMPDVFFEHKICSFDIEVYSPADVDTFPLADDERVRVIIIACCFNGGRRGKLFYLDELQRNMNLDTATYDVYRYVTEKELLQAFIESITPQSVDILTGYNIKRFDLKFIYDRCQALYPDLVECFRCWTLDRTLPYFWGDKNVRVWGIVILDVYEYVLNNLNERSNKLKYIASKYLPSDKQKFDMHFKDISKFYFEGSADEYQYTLTYCMQDADIILPLIARLKIIDNLISRACTCHVVLTDAINRGVLWCNTCMITSHVANSTPYVVPYTKQNESDEFQGGYVVEPVAGFHTQPTVVMDFNSLYPTIMIDFNLCFSTLLLSKQTKDSALFTDNSEQCKDQIQGVSIEGLRTSCRMPNENVIDVNRVPYLNNKVAFVREHVRQGILPELLKNLLTNRKKIQLRLKTEKLDKVQYSQLDAQQLSLKLSANASYGLLGAKFGSLYFPVVAASVTAYGRYLNRFKGLKITEMLKEDNINGLVVYGDTDSVMFRVDLPMKEAILLGPKYAERVTQAIGLPRMRTEFEKCYLPFLMNKKKHYTGVAYTAVDVPPKMHNKGNELVRKDSCLLTRKLMECVLKTVFMPYTNDLNNLDEQYNTENLLARRERLFKQFHEILGPWSRVYKHYMETNTAVNENTKDDESLLADIRVMLEDAKFTKPVTKENYINKQPHVEVFKRLKNDRQLRVGDSIVYVLATRTFDTCTVDRVCDMAFDLIEFTNNNLFVAIPHYVDACVVKPLGRLINPISNEYTLNLKQTVVDLFPHVNEKKRKK